MFNIMKEGFKNSHMLQCAIFKLFPFGFIFASRQCPNYPETLGFDPGQRWSSATTCEETVQEQFSILLLLSSIETFKSVSLTTSVFCEMARLEINIGCLARGLGFPIDLFKDNLADEIEQEEHGLCIKEVYKMLDNRLLERAVHRTQNLHTAEWNMNAIRKAASLLDHQAISFEELYNTRVAYQAYEGFDMMGLHIEKQTLLNTLKMCGRSIAPMKLVNRVKHMSNQLEEKGRIQLYEFLDLVMWCGNYENFSLEDVACPVGKERDLFKLVDFEKLLSHHDERLAEKLNNEYLKEEWDFGRENLGSRHMFKDPPVRCAEDRINMTRRQKRLYRHLKAEVNKSQRGVYRAKAGFIRERPLTAPDLSMYASKDEPQPLTSFSAHTAYQIIQDKVKSARPGDTPGTNTSDRPLYVEAEPVEKPLGITEDDLRDTQKKFEVLQFDMETIDGRFQIMMDDTMNTYYPGHKERYQETSFVSKPRPKSEILQLRKHVEVTQKDRPKSESHLLHLQRIEQASKNRETGVSKAPTRESTTAGSSQPDGFHGWQDTKMKQGQHYPLVKSSLSNSYQGRLKEKLTKSANVSKKKVKGDLQHSQTNEDEMIGEPDTIPESRPSTAPVKINSDSNDDVIVKKVSAGDKELSPAESCKTDLSVAESCRTVDTGYSSFDDRSSTVSPKEDFNLVKTKRESSHTSVSGSSVRTDSLSDKHSTPGSPDKRTNSRSNSDWKKSGVEVVPHMEHSKPRPVSVGGIGTISLLENICEARYWEDAYNEEISDETFSGDDSDTRTQLSADSGIGRRQGDELQSSLALLKQRLSEQPVPSKAKRAKTKTNKQVRGQGGDMFEKELRIKKQRRSQRPSSRTSQNLVNNSSSVSPVRNESSRTSQKSNGQPGTRQSASSLSQSVTNPNKSDVCQLNNRSNQSASKQLKPSLHQKGLSAGRKESVPYLNNVKLNKSSKMDDSMVIEMKKNPQIGRLIKRGEGLLSQDLMKKLIAAQA